MRPDLPLPRLQDLLRETGKPALGRKVDWSHVRILQADAFLSAVQNARL